MNKEYIIEKIVKVIMKEDEDYCEGMATELAKKIYNTIKNQDLSLSENKDKVRK